MSSFSPEQPFPARAVGLGGVLPVVYNDSLGLVLPFPFNFALSEMKRPTKPTTLVMPPNSSVNDVSGATWFMYWDGEQDLTFAPNDATTFINGVSANLVFTASGKRTLLLVVNATGTYEIHQINTVQTTPYTLSYISESRYNATYTFPLTPGLITGLSTVETSELSTDWTKPVDNRSGYTYGGTTTRRFKFTVAIGSGFGSGQGLRMYLQLNSVVFAHTEVDSGVSMTVAVSKEVDPGDLFEVFMHRSVGDSQNEIWYTIDVTSVPE